MFGPSSASPGAGASKGRGREARLRPGGAPAPGEAEHGPKVAQTEFQNKIDILEFKNLETSGIPKTIRKPMVVVHFRSGGVPRRAGLPASFWVVAESLPALSCAATMIVKFHARPKPPTKNVQNHKKTCGFIHFRSRGVPRRAGLPASLWVVAESLPALSCVATMIVKLHAQPKPQKTYGFCTFSLSDDVQQ